MLETKEYRPQMSFCLLAYNQKKFIREAVEGALSQTYSPLEIILSDDCSSDGTFEIIKEVVAAYRGKHRVIINRNERNLGVGGHVNRISTLFHGEWYIAAAGDDISLPDRVEVIWKYSKRYPEASAICSRYRAIDYEGAEVLQKAMVASDLPLIIPKCSGNVLPIHGLFGCTSAWHRSVVESGVPNNVVCEDLFLTYRAFLKGELVLIPEILVNYRVGVGLTSYVQPASSRQKFTSFLDTERHVARFAQWRAVSYAAATNELKTISINDKYRALRRDLLSKYIFYRTVSLWPDCGRGGWLKAIFDTCVYGSLRQISDLLVWMSRRMFGIRVFFLGWCFMKKIKHYKKNGQIK